MPQISLVTEDIRAAAQKLRTKSEEMNSAIQTANSAINPLRDFKSNRINRDVADWDNLKGQFQKALDALLKSADELVAAAVANEDANK
jgi:uncharacterized protein YukE